MIRLTGSEEQLLQLYRNLDIHQRNEIIEDVRALVTANRLIQTKLKKPLKLVGNRRILAKYGLPNLRPSLPRRTNKTELRRRESDQDDSKSK